MHINSFVLCNYTFDEFNAFHKMLLDVIILIVNYFDDFVLELFWKVRFKVAANSQNSGYLHHVLESLEILCRMEAA